MYSFIPSVPAVLAELQQADLITSEECKKLRFLIDIVRIQRTKSPRVVTETASILRRNGYEDESKLLIGTYTYGQIYSNAYYLVLL